MTPKSAKPWQKLQALVAAIDAAAGREPYPRLALLMQNMTIQQAGRRAVDARATYG